jgi:DNA-binding transcriptional MocR family regulator
MRMRVKSFVHFRYSSFLLIELVGTWWKREELPFPSIKTLAVRCGVSDRQVQRAINNLEHRGLLKRTKRRSNNGIIASNAYDLKPATAFLEEVARMFPNEYPRQIEKLSLRTNVYIEPRPKGRPEGSAIEGYVVEDFADSVLGTFPTQAEAIEWARKQDLRPLVARIRHLNDKKTADHWRAM